MKKLDVNAIKKEICSNFEIEEKSDDRFIIHTWFTYHDGDELRIILEMTDEICKITDEGHTMMWFSYSDYTFTEMRMDLLNRILRSNDVQMEDGEIYIECPPQEIGRSLNSIIQALLQITDLSFLSLERVASTFIEDLKGTISSIINEKAIPFTISYDTHIKSPSGDIHNVDIVIESPTPIYVLGISNKDRCKDAIITLLSMKEVRFKSIVVIDDRANIPKKDVNMLVNHANRPIFGIESEPLQKYIVEVTAT